MTNFKELSASFPSGAEASARSTTRTSGAGEWVNAYSRVHRRQEKYMRDAEILRVDVLKQRENELEKYRREMFTGGPKMSRVDSLTVSKTQTALKPLTNNTVVPSKVSMYSSLSPTFSPTRLKWPSSVPPRLRNPGQTSPLRKKSPRKLPPLRGTLETNYVNIASKYGTKARQTEIIGYRLPRKEWSPAESTPKDLEGNPSRMSEISKIWEHGTCIYCELERLGRSLPPRVLKWESKERDRTRNAVDVVTGGGDGGGGDDHGGGGDDHGDGSGDDDRRGAYINWVELDRKGDEHEGVDGEGEGVDVITEMMKANKLRVEHDDQWRPDFEPYNDAISNSDNSSITGDHSVIEETIIEYIPHLKDWSNDDDDDDVEVDFEALQQLAKWYERYPSTPVSFWKQGVQRQLPTFLTDSL